MEHVPLLELTFDPRPYDYYIKFENKEFDKLFDKYCQGLQTEKMKYEGGLLLFKGKLDLELIVPSAPLIFMADEHIATIQHGEETHYSRFKIFHVKRREWHKEPTCWDCFM